MTANQGHRPFARTGRKAALPSLKWKGSPLFNVQIYKMWRLDR